MGETEPALHENPEWKASMDALITQMAELQTTIDVLVAFLGLDRRRLNKLLAGTEFFSKQSGHFNAFALKFQKRYEGMLIPYTDVAKRRKP
jgi:hypothetical protein